MPTRRYRIRQRVGSVWFLRVAAPIYCKTIAYLFNISLCYIHNTKAVAKIRPLPKLPALKKHADYRPITPYHTNYVQTKRLWSRLMERNVVRTFHYPTFLDPPSSLAFSDQFAFHPSGSTSAAIISLLHTVVNLLQFNPFVLVISWTFPRRSTLFKTPHCCPSWLNSTCRHLSATGWWTFQRPLAPYNRSAFLPAH